jgi:hypothetical protein
LLALRVAASALGRSSIYHRLHLRKQPFDSMSPTLVQLEKIGETSGYGHFHLPDDLFEKLRRLIGQEDHTYYNGYEFGDGPNWRIRVARVGLEKLGLGPDLVRHGIKREVYAMPLTDNFRDMLKGKARRLTTKRPSVREIASVALERWLLPRAQTRREYRNVRKDVYLATQKHILINVTN